MRVDAHLTTLILCIVDQDSSRQLAVIIKGMQIKLSNSFSERDIGIQPSGAPTLVGIMFEDDESSVKH